MKKKIYTTILACAMTCALVSTAVGANDASSTALTASPPATSQAPGNSWKTVATQTITAGDVTFAYRELGKHNGGTPVVFLVHLAAVLDNWDPRIVDGFASRHRVITFDNRGVGASSGAPAASMEEMARDAITFIRAMGLDQVDLFGFSMGGMVAQEIVLMQPQLVRRMIIAEKLNSSRNVQVDEEPQPEGQNQFQNEFEDERPDSDI